MSASSNVAGGVGRPRFLSQNLDRVLYVLIIVCVVYATIWPLGLPVPISKETRDLYDFIEQIPAGSAVYLGFDYEASGIAEMEPCANALVRHCFSKDLRLICAGLTAPASDLIKRVMNAVSDDYPDKEYGVDWVNLGYRPGWEVALEAMTVDFQEAAGGLDYIGNRIEGFQIMDQVKSLKDVALAVSIGSMREGIARYVQIIGSPLGVPVTGCCSGVTIPELVPLYRAGQLKGFLKGLAGAAEYENLIKRPGIASAGMDAQSLTHLLLILFACIGNLQYFLSRKGDGEGSSNV